MPLETGQAEMDVGQPDGSLPAADFRLEPADERAAALFQRNREIDVDRVDQRPAAEDGVAVVADLSEPNVPLISPVGQLHRVGEQINLAIVARTLRPVVDFLQQGDVGLVVANRFDNPREIVPPVETADSFVDVVTQQTKSHPSQRGATASNRQVERQALIYLAPGQ